jgi:hypothetical protein
VQLVGGLAGIHELTPGAGLGLVVVVERLEPAHQTASTAGA